MRDKIDRFYIELNNLKKDYIKKQQIIKLKEKYNELYLSEKKNKKFRKEYKNLDKNIVIWNEMYIKKEQEEANYILKDINGYKLDKEQIKAVITEEQNNLVVAGAGSGKTLTIVGKIRYLVERKNVNLKDILCISFTNDATKSLKQSLSKIYNYELTVLTFHKLSLQIIKGAGEKVAIADDKILIKTVENYLNKIIYSDVESQNLIKKYFLHIPFFKNSKNVDTFPLLYEKILSTIYFINFQKIIVTFINLMKSNQLSLDNFEIWIKKSYKYGLIETKETFLLKIIKKIYIEYESYLKINNLIDFNDMINKATDIVKKNGISNYRYVIIDEYQDTSLTRYKLVKAIIDKTNSILIAVGDDFQSIYRFTGCDLNIFLNFEKYFGDTKILKINNTYRNSKELIDVAGSFVMKNKKQIKKQLVSSKRESKPIEIYYYNNFIETFIELLNKIPYKNIYVLGRNNNDIKKILDYEDFISNDNKKIIYKKNKDLNINFLTVHKSKGLEEEAVIIINLENKKTGFPSSLEDDHILKYVNRYKEYFEFEEERRLFYVGLTRTKNKNYLLVPNKNPSIFVKELIKNYKSKITIIKTPMIK